MTFRLPVAAPLGAALAFTMLAPAHAQDAPAIRAFLLAQPGVVSPTRSAESLVAAAVRAGVANGQDGVSLAKRVLRELRAGHQRSEVASVALGAGGGPQAVGPELEYNDHPGLADTAVAGANVATGVITDGDVDTFRVQVATDSVVRFVTAGNGANQIGDTILVLTDVDGQLIDSNDDTAVDLYSQIDARLPAGTYFVKVQAGFGAARNSGYRLAVTINPVVIPTLSSGQSINAAFSTLADRHVYALTLTADSAVTLGTTGAGGDLLLSLHRPQMGRVHLVDDSVAGPYPALTTRLPAGRFYVVVTPSPFAPPGAYRISATIAPFALPAAPCNGSTGGSTVGAETHHVFRLVNAAPARVRMATSGGTLFDTVVELFDDRFAKVAYNDDANSSYGLLDTALPQGTYYLVVRPFPGNAGTYTLTMTCAAAAALPPLRNGRSTASIGTLGNTAAFAYSVGTAGPVEFRIDQQASAIGSGMITVLDSNGHVAGFDDATVFWDGDAMCGATLAPGDYTVLARDLYGAPGTLGLVVQPQLFVDPFGAAARLHSLDKAGRVHVLFASDAAAPGFALGGAISGLLLLNPGVLVFVGPGPIGAAGTYAWPLPVAGFAGALQAVSFDPATITGAMTNVVR